MAPTRNPVGWFEIYVDDMPRAKTFYEAVFATTLQPLGNPTTDDTGLEMWQFPGDRKFMVARARSAGCTAAPPAVAAP